MDIHHVVFFKAIFVFIKVSTLVKGLSMKVSLTHITLTSFLVVSSCSNEGVGSLNSTVNSIASPGNPGAPNVLYWVDKGEMSRATCIIDKPTTRENCTANLSKIAIAEVTKRAGTLGQGGIDAANANIAAEIKALKDVDPSVVSLNQQIESMTKQKSATQIVVNTDTKLIETSTKEKAQLDERIVADDEQLAAIAKQLQMTPNDARLLELQAKVQAERLDLLNQSSAVANRIQTIQKHLAWQQSTLVSVDNAIKAKQTELKNVIDQLVVYSAKLDQLNAAGLDAQASLAGLTKVMSLIAQGDITFHGNLLNTTLQGSLILVDRSFEPAMELKFGRYKVESGFSSFCAQKIEPLMQGGDVRIDITLQAPCNVTKLPYVCDKVSCKNNATRYFTVMNATHYTYVEGANKAVFVLDSAQ